MSIQYSQDYLIEWELLLLLISNEEKKIDRTSDSEIEVMNYYYNNDGMRRILSQWLQQMHAAYAVKPSATDTPTKSEEVASYWRQRGNDLFHINAIEKSYRCYNKSVLYAEPGGKTFPLAIANRSATLLHMKRYQDCIADIDLALRHNHEQKHKLLLRKADCLAEMDQLDKAQEAYDSARTFFQEHYFERHVADFERHAKHVLKKIAKVETGEAENLSEEFTIPEEYTIPNLFKEENENFVSASSAVELRRSDVTGRHVVCVDAAQRGDVLFAEEPYAFVALPVDGDLPVVCEQCCRDELNPVPCTQCSRAVYCSDACRRAGWEVHHQWECAGARSRLFSTIGIAHLALRMFLVSSKQGFPKVEPGPSGVLTAADLFHAYSSRDNVAIYKKDEPPFYRMFNLVTNFDKMNNDDHVQYAVTAVCITLYLEQWTSFFDQRTPHLPPLPANEQRLFVAAFLLRALGQLVTNGHAALSLISEIHGDSYTVSEREVRYATAIYPSIAMMNHSCDPNIINTWYRCRLLVRCSREIPAGAEVVNCYGPHKARAPAADRRADLRSQYAFTCECDACRDLDRTDFVLLFSAYLCQKCKGPVCRTADHQRPRCTQCHDLFDLSRAAGAIEYAEDIQAQADQCLSSERRLELLQAALRVRQTVWHRHHADLRRNVDQIARLHAELGDFTKSIDLIKQNIQSLEYQYGSFSPEVAHDLKKLADVMLQRIVRLQDDPDIRNWCLEAHKILKKAVLVMELQYGGWSPVTKRLRAQEAAAVDLIASCSDPADELSDALLSNVKI